MKARFFFFCRRGVPAGSRRSRRCATIGCCPSVAFHRRFLAGLVLVGAGPVLLWLGLFSDLPHGGWLTGAGVLAHPARAAGARALVAVPAVPGGRADGRTPRLFGTVGLLAGQNAMRNRAVPPPRPRR